MTEKALGEIVCEGPVADFLNTRTPLYRERKVKERPPSKEEEIELMLQDPIPLKRAVSPKGRKTVLRLDEAGSQGASLNHRF